MLQSMKSGQPHCFFFFFPFPTLFNFLPLLSLFLVSTQALVTGHFQCMYIVQTKNQLHCNNSNLKRMALGRTISKPTSYFEPFISRGRPHHSQAKDGPNSLSHIICFCFFSLACYQYLIVFLFFTLLC